MADLRQPLEADGGTDSDGLREESLQEDGEGEDEDEFYPQSSPIDFDFGSFSPDYDLDYYMNSSLNFGNDLDSDSDDHGCQYEETIFGGEEEDEDPMNFITDLFESRLAAAAEDPWEVGSGLTDEPSLGYGFLTGHPAVDSESDSGDFEVNPGLVDAAENQIYLNHLHAEIEMEEFEWEEVSERLESENLNSVINRIEEISISSEISSSEEEDPNALLADEGALNHLNDQQNAEWEVLLAMNNIDATIAMALMEEEEEEDGDEEDEDGGVVEANGDGNDSLHVLHLPEDYILSMEYNALFGQFPDNNDNPSSKGSPPASKSAVENLRRTVLTKREVGEDRAPACAVCKEEFAAGEEATAMPCRHMYHGECIVPWLGIRNTCPVCRYELPTDDENYEKRRGGRGGGGGGGVMEGDEFAMRYNFEVLPL